MLQPNDIYIYTNLASLYYKVGNYEKAIENNIKIVKIDPDSKDEYYNLFTLYFHQKEYYNSFLSLINLFYLNIKLLIDFLTRYLVYFILIFLSIYSIYFGVTYKLAVYYYKKENYDKSIKYLKRIFKRIFKFKSNKLSMLVLFALYYYNKKEYDSAIEYLKRSLELKPDNLNILNLLGSSYYNKEEYDFAIEIYQREIEYLKKDNSNDDSNLTFAIACCYSLLNKNDLAIEYLKKTIEKNIIYKEKAKTDQDFNNIRELDSFKNIIDNDEIIIQNENDK